jgi:hypothetical protein
VGLTRSRAVPSTKQRRRLEYEEARKGRPKLVPEKPSPYQAKGLQNEGGPYQYQNQYQYENHTRAVGEEIEDGNVSQMRLLLLLYETREIEPFPVFDLPRLKNVIGAPTENDRRLYDLFRLRFGLLLADVGSLTPLPLATSELVRERITVTKGGASQLIHRFERAGVVHYAGSLPALGKGDGTRTFLPGAARP